MSRRIHLFDTTLRDGNKLAFVVLSVPDRVAVARQLVRLGVDVIDAGYPAASAEDREVVAQIAREVRGTRISALCRTIDRDVAEALRLLEPAEQPYLQIFMPISGRFLRDVLGKDGRQVLHDVRRTVRDAAAALGSRGQVQFSLSEVAGADPELLLDALRAAAESGASVVNVADTNGTLFPGEAGDLVRSIRRALPDHPGVRIGVHFHNDLGLATACTLAAVEAGADHLEVTVGGIGSRAGNAALEEVVYGLEFLSHRLELTHALHLDQLYATARLVGRITGLKPHPNKPIIGRCAFLENRESQARQALPGWAEELLRERTIGRPAAVALDPGEAAAAEQEPEPQEALPPETLSEKPAAYTLLSYNVMTGSNAPPVGVVEVEHGGRRFVQASPGNGAVDALCRAVDRAAGVSPRLILYSVDALSEGKDARAEVTVTLSHQGRRFHGHAASTDVVGASVLAYLAAVNRIAAAGAGESVPQFYVEGEYLWE